MTNFTFTVENPLTLIGVLKFFFVLIDAGRIGDYKDVELDTSSHVDFSSRKRRTMDQTNSDHEPTLTDLISAVGEADPERLDFRAQTVDLYLLSRPSYSGRCSAMAFSKSWSPSSS